MVSFMVLGIAAPALLYILIMGLLGWSSSSTEAGTLIFGNRDKTIFLYEAPATVQHFARIGGNYENLLGSWRNYFADRNKGYKTVKDAEEIIKLKSGVLILPSAVALSDAERAAIKVFRDRGGSILATWATGTRNEKGDWVGWGFLEELGASEIEPMPKSADAKFLVMVGEAPVSHTHLAGQRIPMNKPAETLLKMKGNNVAGRFMNSDRIQTQDNRDEGAVIYLERPQKLSRSVVFAFGESAWETKPFATQVLIEDALKWLSHEVTVTKSAWPMGLRSAQVIQMDVDDQMDNAAQFAASLKSAGFPATFFIPSAAISANPKLVEALSKDFEIAYHGDTYAGFRGSDALNQRRRLSTMVREMKDKLPNLRGIIGFRAPLENADLETDTELRQMDIRYHATDGARSDARLPLFAAAPPATAQLPNQELLLLLPRTQRDDQALLASDASPTQLNQRLLDDFNEAFNSGALGWLTVHSKNWGSDGALTQAFAQYLENAKKFKKSVWFANAGQVHQWWRDRERIRVDSSFDGKRVDFNVTVIGETPVTGASFVVMLPSKASKPNVRAIKVGVTIPKVVPIDDFRALIVFEQTNPGNYNYSISFDAK